jgi:DNA polymerase III subunit beta
MSVFFTLNQKEFVKTLAICSQVSQKKSDVEILTFSKILVQKDKIEFMAVGTATFFKTNLKPENLDLKEDKVEFLIKTDSFAQAVSLISDKDIGIEVDLEKLNLTIKSAKTKHKLRINLELIDEYYKPEREGNEVSKVIAKVKTADFVSSIKASFISVGSPKSTYDQKFLSICLTANIEDKKLIVVSTDRYRITKTSLSFEILKTNLENNEQKTNFLFSPKNLQLLISTLAQGSESEVSLDFGLNFLWINFGNSELVIKYNQGEYPDYEKIIPQSFTCQFETSVSDLLEGLKQVYFCAKNNVINKSITIKVEPANQKIFLSAQTETGEASESEVILEKYEGTQENWTQSFNADYLTSYLSILENEKVLWESNPGRPSVLSPLGQKNKQLYLVSGLK